MTTSSAYPDRLLAYASAMKPGATALAGAGRNLSGTIQAFIATHPDPQVISGVTDWGQELTTYASRNSQIGQWVHDIGVAFRAAERGNGSGQVTVSDSRLNQLVARADPAVRRALTYFLTHLGNDSWLNGDRGTQNSIVEHLRGLSPEQIDEFLAALSNQDLQKWNKAIPSSSFLWYSWGLDSSHKIELSNLLFTSASAAQLARLEKYMPTLQPNPTTQEIGGPFRWLSIAGIPLFQTGPDGKPILNAFTDINQGDMGDCWVLSGLGAIAMANPQLLQSHIRANANGTYTVTLYQNGKPVEITVTDTVPYSPKAGWDYPYAHDLNGNDQWAMIYEKAYAELKGGYQTIEGGFGDISMSALTGQPGNRTSPGQISLTQIDNLRAQGYAFTAGTNPGNNDREDGGQLVGSHEYMVEAVNTTNQTITLLNPWGAQGAAPHTVTLSWQDFQTYFGTVSYVKVPGAA